jgi:hypothetical protein
MPAGSTYTPIATTTTSGNATSYTFTSIPSTYTDLIVVCNVAADVSTSVQIQVGNGSADTGTNYSWTYVLGNGSSAVSGRASNSTYYLGGDLTGGESSTDITHIFNYANTTTNKTVIARGSAAGLNTYATVGLWRSTAAINTVKVFLETPRYFTNNSKITLYGIAAA